MLMSHIRKKKKYRNGTNFFDTDFSYDYESVNC